MVNTFILSHPFEYLEPHTLDEALHYLFNHKEKVKVIAGGTDLLVQMKTGKVSPSCLLNLSKISALRYVIEQDGLRMGALTTFRDLQASPYVQKRYTALFEAAKAVSTVQIQTMGTLGGNLCNGSPAADSAPPLLVFNGKVKLMTGWQERKLSLEDFFIGPGKTALQAGEILTEIQLEEVNERTGSAFKKLGRVAADLSKVSIAVAVVLKDEFCKECRIALGAVAPVPMRVRKSEEILIGRKWEKNLINEVSLHISEEISPIDDIRSTAWYRREVVKALARETIQLAWERAAS